MTKGIDRGMQRHTSCNRTHTSCNQDTYSDTSQHLQTWIAGGARAAHTRAGGRGGGGRRRRACGGFAVAIVVAVITDAGCGLGVQHCAEVLHHCVWLE